MHIIDYLSKHKMRVLDFASKMKVTTFSVYRWIEGRIPQPGKIEQIKELSNGEITEDDWGPYRLKQSGASKRKANSKPAGCNSERCMEGDETREIEVPNGANTRQNKTS